MTKGFSFQTPLESEVLGNFYEGNYEHALEMFELFIVQIPIESHALQEQLEARNLEGCRAILHRIKPNFTMVGNAPLSDFCTRIEGQIKNGILDKDAAYTEISSIVEEMSETVKFLTIETTNLRQYLGK